MKNKRKSRVHVWEFTRTPINLHDPRMPVIRHMEWEPLRIANFHDKTRWNGLEPDSYTHGFWDERPHYIDGIKDQCWYRDYQNGGWISLYVIKDIDYALYSLYRMDKTFWGIWHTNKPKEIRPRIPRIIYDNHIKWGKTSGRTDDERLFDLGFYDRLLARGADANWLIERTGEARPMDQLEEQDEEA